LDALAPALDRASLAWAAGFFDGEGSTMLHADKSRPGYLRLEVAVPQADHDGVPTVLLRFQDAIGGLGRIVGPEDDDLYKWISRGRLEAMAVIALIWDQLGQVKRLQADAAIKRFLSQYESNPSLARSGRHVGAVFNVLNRDLTDAISTRQLELAWAAGFMDGEGCFGLVRSTARVRGPRWYKVRASATQHGQPHVVPDVLDRLRCALGGIGRIERHSGVDAFKWVVEGDAQVGSVVEVLAPFLGERKVAQARDALDVFRAQPRLKGDASRCVRGHEYSYTAMRGGRLRRICNPCARILERRARARQGIPPRPFRNAARRYTE
jgi:hypothetical protein